MLGGYNWIRRRESTADFPAPGVDSGSTRSSGQAANSGSGLFLCIPRFTSALSTSFFAKLQISSSADLAYLAAGSATFPTQP
jgi:hypothetical protein